MTRLPHVTWLRAFEAAARHSSFTAAAEELNLTPAAVSQQIRLLEGHVGVQLFRRLPRGVVLSDQGQAYALPIRKAFREMQAATGALFEVKRRRKVHLRASISYAALVLAPRLPAFSALHPEIELHLSTTVWSDRFDDEAIDLDIRYGSGDWGERSCWPLAHERGVVVCSPAHAARFGPAPDIAALVADHVVQVVGSEVEWTNLAAQFGLSLPAPRHVTKVDSSLMALQTLAAGPGVALILESLARRDIERGLLTCPVEHSFPIRDAYYLVAREAALERAEVRALRDWIVEQEAAGEPQAGLIGPPA
jgi:LysR family glycine cleavage system transcriptional activator